MADPTMMELIGFIYAETASRESTSVSRVWRTFDYDRWYELRQRELEEVFE